MKFANGGVERYRESALPADEIGPFELYAEAVAFLGYFERIRGKRDDVVVSVDLQGTFQGFIEWRHLLRARREHPVDRGEMASRIGQHFSVGGMIGVLDGDDGAAQLRVFVAQIARELLLGLRGSDHQNLVHALERVRDGVIV